MRRIAVIAAREFRATFGTTFGYGLTAGFLAFAGLLLVLALRSGEARLDAWFAWLFVALGVLAPLLAMRTFAEEERAGSLELLLTSPLHVREVVLGKTLGVVAIFLVLVTGTLVCPWLLDRMGDPDGGPVLTGYVGLLLVGIAFLSVGIAASAATPNQLVAAAISTGLLLALWFGAGVADVVGGSPREALRYLSPSTHVTGFLRGTLALDDVTYFVSMIVLALGAAIAVVEARR